MRLYLAGPDVFRPDAKQWADEARALLAQHGHTALIPLDNEETSATGIYRANIALIQSADAVLANLDPFRGHEPDSGTCFEAGYAVALGKPVIAYLTDGRPQLEKIATDSSGHMDNNGMLIENFGLPVNLMLGISCRIVPGTLVDALQVLAEQ